MQSLQLIIEHLQQHLGNLPHHVERDNSNLHFMEVPLIDSMGAISQHLVTPVMHHLVVHVECVAQGSKLDTCLVLFIRRVFEEIDRVSRSQEVVSSGCIVKSGMLLLFLRSWH